MKLLPTLIVVEEPIFSESAVRNVALVLRSIEAGFPTSLVTSKDYAHLARETLPGNCILETAESTNSSDRLSAAIVAGVQAAPNANGWIIIPRLQDTVEPEIFLSIADIMKSRPIVYTQYRNKKHFPIGFSSEFFSELIRIDSMMDINRIINKYPSSGVEGLIPSTPLT